MKYKMIKKKNFYVFNLDAPKLNLLLSKTEFEIFSKKTELGKILNNYNNWSHFVLMKYTMQMS